MGDLAERMHAGIGAAGAAWDGLFAGEGLDRFGQSPLHGGPFSCTCQPTNGVPSYSRMSL